MDWKWLEEFAEGMIKPLLALIMVLISITLSYFQKLGLEGEMIYSITRAFLQLYLTGIVLEFIFNQKNCTLIIIVTYIIMICVAGYTAGQRAKHIPRGMFVAGASILVGTSLTTFLFIVLQVFPFTPRYIIPVLGTVVGSSLNVTGVAMKRLHDEIKIQTNLVETALALGATSRQATMLQVKRSLIIALSPPLDNAKTMGIVLLPGTMTGLIMGGASPLAAIQLQIVIMNLNFGASTVSSIISTYLCLPFLFTKAHQLQTEVFISAD